jgi:hypothetical protein
MSIPNDPQDPDGAQPQDPYGGPEQPAASAYPVTPYGAAEQQHPAGSPYPAAPQYGDYAQPAPPNYLVWAVLTTLLCCLPLGVAAIVFSSQVNSKWMAGDFPGAQDASRKARNFSIWSAAIGVALYVVVAVVAIAIVIGVSNNNS